MIDHIRTALDLERLALTTTNIAKANGTVAGNKQAAEAQDTLLGIADWHRDQAAQQAQNYTSAEMRDLTKAAAKSLTTTTTN